MRLTTRKTAVLWTIQGLLAALFLFAGSVKLVVPVEMMTAQTGLSGGFIRFIGVAEVLGAAGLILPGLFRIGQALTPVAAAGLVIIMIGATVISLPGGVAAVMPFVVGILAACVAYTRWRSLSLQASA